MSALSGSKANGLTLKRFSIYSALKTNLNDLICFLNLVIHSQVASGEIEAVSGLPFLPLRIGYILALIARQSEFTIVSP